MILNDLFATKRHSVRDLSRLICFWLGATVRKIIHVQTRKTGLKFAEMVFLCFMHVCSGVSLKQTLRANLDILPYPLEGTFSWFFVIIKAGWTACWWCLVGGRGGLGPWGGGSLRSGIPVQLAAEKPPQRTAVTEGSRALLNRCVALACPSTRVLWASRPFSHTATYDVVSLSWIRCGPTFTQFEKLSLLWLVSFLLSPCTVPPRAGLLTALSLVISGSKQSWFLLVVCRSKAFN